MIIDLNAKRPRYKRIAASIFRLAIIFAIGIGFYYMTKGV